jgi:hypothetical protein
METLLSLDKATATIKAVVRILLLEEPQRPQEMDSSHSYDDFVSIIILRFDGF